MRWNKGHFFTSLFGFIIPILAALIYFYVSSNKNLKLFFEAEKIVFVDLDKEYDIENDPNNIISIDKENLLITFNYSKIQYNNILIENGKLTSELNTEYLIHGKYYEVDKNFNLKKINYSKKLKDALTDNAIIIGMSVIVIATSVVIAAYMIAKKMDVMKKYRRYTVLTSLIVLTLITLILSMITTQMFVGFGAVTIAWTIHTISWTVKRKLNNLPLFEDQRVRVVIENE